MKHMGQDERNRIEFMLGCVNNVASIAKAIEDQLVTVPGFFSSEASAYSVSMRGAVRPVRSAMSATAKPLSFILRAD